MIILTGGAGFIGSALLSYLNAAGHKDILVVDNLSSNDKWKNLNGKTFREYWPKQKFLNEIKENKLSSKIEAVIHLGACSSTLEKNVDYLLENNYRYSIEVANFCQKNAIRFIYASSGATYGDGKHGFSDKQDIRSLKPLNPYGYSKQIFDIWAEDNKVLETAVGIKFFNVFGPNEYHKGPMQSMVLKGYEQIAKSSCIKLYKDASNQYGDGGQLRDFIYVKDCCEVILWFLNNPKISGLYNLGFGKARSWNDLAKALFSATKIPQNIQYIDMPADLARQYQNFTEAEISKLRLAGYKKDFTLLEEAVADYVQAYLARDNSFL